MLGADDALTATELDWIRMHSSLGHALLAGLDGLGGARAVVLSHHEYWDGSGYPEGRRETDSPRAARVFCLVDSYEAIVRDDVGYRARRDHDIARDEILELAACATTPSWSGYSAAWIASRGARSPSSTRAEGLAAGRQTSGCA